MENENFAAFILTHGRPDKVYTYKSLRKSGYTGKVYFIVDDEDKTLPQYIENFGKENVIIFSKKEIAKTFDSADNFEDRRAIVYARNACFEIAEKLGIEHFIQLDDDYTAFRYRFNNRFEYKCVPLKSLDRVFKHLLVFFKETNCLSIAFLQDGDMIGGSGGGYSKEIRTYRKCMNTFICSTNRRFNFVGRVNEDVNTYTWFQGLGHPFLSINNVTITQKTTQANSGGMTEMYLESGTYWKSFYTVMFCPSSVKVSMMGELHRRLHHRIKWANTVPMIISEDLKKK